MTAKIIEDGFESVLRVEIVSDSRERVEAFAKWLADLILMAAGNHDVMVTVHDITDEPLVKQGD